MIKRRDKPDRADIDSAKLTRNLIYYSEKSIDSVYKTLKTDKNGISSNEAVNRLEK